MPELVVRTSKPESLSAHLNPLAIARSAWSHRELIRSFAAREILEQHKGAFLGIAWNVLQPLISLAIFTVVFGFIFGSRWDKGNLPPHFDFPLTFFTGQLLYQVFAEVASKSPTLVSSRPNLVRKVVFPLEILPFTVVWAALVHAGISLAILLVVLFIVTGTLQLSVLLLPVVVVPLVFICLGTSWLLSALGVFIRDMRHIVMVAVQLLMFLTPLFYQVERIPTHHMWLRNLITYNPLSIIVENGRRCVLWGEGLDWASLAGVTALGLVLMLIGHVVFSACRRSMADAH